MAMNKAEQKRLADLESAMPDSKIDDGGAAFAMPASEHSQGGHFEQRGLSRRDYFAAAALTGFTAGTFWAEVDNDEAAKAAYAVADAMIAASKTGGPEHG